MHGWVISKRPDDAVNNIKDSIELGSINIVKRVASVRNCFIKYIQKYEFNNEIIVNWIIIFNFLSSNPLYLNTIF